MIFYRMSAVLFISLMIMACSNSRASSDAPWYTDRSYRVEEISTVSADGFILVKLSDDVENNRSNSGKSFRVHILNLSVADRPSLTGTYIWVQGAKGVDGKLDLSRLYGKARISVRKEEQRKKWDDFIREQKDILYGPRDVLPPQPQKGR